MLQPVHEVIIDLLISYNTKEAKPTLTEIMAIENAMPYVEGHLDPVTYRSYLDWIERNKTRLEA